MKGRSQRPERVGGLHRLRDELAQAWTVAVKDVRVYYLTPPMIMFGLMMPFFMFFSFSVRREMAATQGIARLLALVTFFTASSAGPVIIPLERRVGTYDRLLAAPMSLVTLLLGKTLVGTFFALAVSAAPLSVGLLWLHVAIADTSLLLAGLLLASLAFSAFGLAFASIPTRSVGNIMMPSTLIRWPLMFVSGIFIPLEEMASWTRVLSYVSPLTYAQDLMNHAVLGQGVLNPWLDLAALLASGVLFLVLALRTHHWSRRLGY
jgi:ABC-2 type transport system permease protein